MNTYMQLILHEQTKEIKTWKNNFQNIYPLFLNPPKEKKKEEKEMAGAFLPPWTPFFTYQFFEEIVKQINGNNYHELELTCPVLHSTRNESGRRYTRELSFMWCEN